MCLKDKVKQCGAGYGMEIYTDRELVSLMTGLNEDIAAKIDMSDPIASMSIKGVGKKTMMVMEAINEYARRKYERVDKRVIIIHGPEDAYEYAKNKLQYEQKEHFCVILLNTKNHIIGFREVSVGSLSASVVHPREVMLEAVKAHAASIILVHNHPSGDPTPSREDVNITDQLCKAGKVIDIPVLDHIIIGHNRFISLKEKGMVS
ncbi:RadC family protein [Mitsuokella jalaludinii]|uniref:RadC family protein n=1 Tax=Mitsuokella jalaludinii TaxID=187979 RepID=UPI00307A4ACB